jgi:phage terminase large subunit GpA-like protein
VVFRKSTQVGWSSILNAVVGYYIAADPSPILFATASKEAAEEYSKKRIAPLIEDCEALRSKIRVAHARKSGNTLMLKEFDGGFLRFTGAKSPLGFRSDQIRIFIGDELDGWDDDCGGEGHGLDVGARRTDTYEDAKILIGGTPAKPKGISRTEIEFQKSDQRYFWVPCPHCGFMQPLVWRDSGEFIPEGEEAQYHGVFGTGVHRVRWEKDAKGAPVPGSIRYFCAKCDQGIDEKFKQKMLNAGDWRPRFPDRRSIDGFKVPGFAINALYAPWKSTVWSEMAQEWWEARDNPEALKTFVNLRLGETWDEGSERVDAHSLLARLEKYKAEVPQRCCLLVASADVQGGRIEAQITGFGPNEESWLICHEVFWGDPGVMVDPNTGISVWAELEKFLLREWQHESGAKLRPAISLVDSGSNTDAVYDYVLPRQTANRRVYACKGVEYLSRPGMAKEGTAKRHHIRLWDIATTSAKDRILARLKIPPSLAGEPKPGYHHLPDFTTEEYLQQLTSEQKITIRDKRTRRLVQRYVSNHTRNEALDLTVYAHGGLFILQNYIDPMTFRNWEGLAKSIADRREYQQKQGYKVLSQGIKL